MIFQGCFVLFRWGPKWQKKHWVTIQTLLLTTQMIDCIRFANLSLYSVNTAPVCKIRRLGSYCKNKKTNSYIGSWFLPYMRGMVNVLDVPLTNQVKVKVLRFKWETPLKSFCVFLLRCFHTAENATFLCVTYCIWYINHTRQFRLILLFVVIF